MTQSDKGANKRVKNQTDDARSDEKKEKRPEDTGAYPTGGMSEASMGAAGRSPRGDGNSSTVSNPEPLSTDADELGRRALEEATGER